MGRKEQIYNMNDSVIRKKTALLQQCMDSAVEKSETAGCSLVLLRDGREICCLNSGYASVENRIPVRRDSIVRLYSMSKVVTSAAAMLLMQDGKLDLYDEVERYFASFHGQKVISSEAGQLEDTVRPVMIRDLLNMTSGLCYPGTDNEAELASDVLFQEMMSKLGTPEALTTEQFAERMGNCPLAFQPGSNWQYGTSADVLAAVIEKVADMPYHEFLDRNFFSPLGMKDTGFYVPDSKKNRLASAYYCTEDGKTPGLYLGNNLAIRNDGGPNPFESGGAGLFSTLDDMARFSTMLANEGSSGAGEILRPGTMRFMRSASLSDQCQKVLDNWLGLEGFSYGNLMRVLKDPSRNGTIGEDGEYGWDGWLGPYLSIAPESRTVILMMMQRVDYGTGHFTRRLRNIIYS